MNDFEEYTQAGEPGQREKAQIWRTAIGLQKVVRKANLAQRRRGAERRKT